MSTKLTLRLEDKLINNAKKAARSRGVSLSKMVGDYFTTISSQQNNLFQESPVLSEISGILAPKTAEKKLIRNYKKHLEEKYQ